MVCILNCLQWALPPGARLLFGGHHTLSSHLCGQSRCDHPSLAVSCTPTPCYPLCPRPWPWRAKGFLSFPFPCLSCPAPTISYLITLVKFAKLLFKSCSPHLCLCSCNHAPMSCLICWGPIPSCKFTETRRCCQNMRKEGTYLVVQRVVQLYAWSFSSKYSGKRLLFSVLLSKVRSMLSYVWLNQVVKLLAIL